MSRFTTGDRVRIDIPDTSDTDHDPYHGMHGTVVEIIQDEAAEVTGDERDGTIYRVDLEMGETVDFRWRDLRPPIE